MKILKLGILFFFFGSHIFSQNTNRIFKSFEENNNHLEVYVSDGKYLITFYNPYIIETSFIPSGETFNPKSHAVVSSSKPVKTELTETNTLIEYKSKGISLSIQKQPFQIFYSYKGQPIISEKNGYVKNDSLETIQFNLIKDEVLYGGGSRALGMNRRGNRLQLYNKAHYGYESHAELLNYSMPIVLSSKQYMIHFDNAPIGFLDLDSKKDNTLAYETISGRKTYQVIVGDSWLDIINNYTDLTGKQPMPPRWALGNFSSRFGYHSQKEVLQTISKFKEEQIPIDAVIIDLYWFGKDIKGTLGNFEFLKDSFPNPEEMIKTLHDENVETILITEPFVLKTSHKWDEAVDKALLGKDSLGNPFVFSFYFGTGGLIDIYNPKAEVWFKNIYKDLSKIGVTGFWGDLGEPEAHPSGLIHATGTANEVHNIYGHDWARLVQEAFQEVEPNKRPFVLMRAGYSGSQRFGLIPWSGDVGRSWGGLQSQPEIVLQMGMQGLGYMHSDLGGFAGANLDDNLYTRWLQYGVFQPIYRPHADETVPSEPVFRSAKAKSLAKESIELRYKLLPYNYNLAFQNNQTGAPLMRPLFFEESDNSELFTKSDTYLWGHDFLISPILKDSLDTKDVYFPKNSMWFDFYSNEKIKGGQTKTVLVKENSIPTYVRAGAFILMAKPMQNTAAYNASNLVLHYYNDDSINHSQRTFYNDDGKTSKSFEKGQFEILEFKYKKEKNRVEFDFESVIGANYSSSTKQIHLIIHNFQKAPKRIKVDNKRFNFDWDEKSKTLTIPVVWNIKIELEIKIRLKK